MAKSFEMQGEGAQHLTVPFEMYNIPGQDPITKVSFSRYIKDKRQDAEIKEVAAHISPSPLRNIIKLRSAPEAEMPGLIESVLEHSDPAWKETAAEYIKYAPEESRSGLKNIVLEKVREGLESTDTKIQEATFRMVRLVQIKEVADLIKLALENSNLNLKRFAADMIKFAPEEDKDVLRNIVLEKVREGLRCEDTKMQEAAAKMISYAPNEEAISLRTTVSEKIHEGLRSDNTEAQLNAAKMISSARIKDVPSLIRQGLIHSNPDVQSEVMNNLYLVYHYAKEEVPGIIKIAFSHPNIQVQAKGIDAIRFLNDDPERLDFKKNAYDKIRDGLQSTDNKTQEGAMILLENAGNIALGGISDLIKLVLKNPNLEIKKKGVAMVGTVIYSYSTGTRSLLDIIIKQGLGDELIKPPLYKNENVSDAVFSRQNFEKTGSETTLFGGSLKGKVIARRLDAQAFLEWQKLYENHEIWKNAGFDYVPIEPILSYRLNKDGFIDVFTGILDLNLRNWKLKTDLFRRELESQQAKILEVLKQAGIGHGHTHNENFCLRFFRNEDNTIDFQRTPRLYLIDFDQAFFPEN